MKEFKIITGGTERRMRAEIARLEREVLTMQASLCNKVLDNESLEAEYEKDVRKIENLRAALAAATGEWTPITSVRTLSKLPLRFYAFNDGTVDDVDVDDVDVVAAKRLDGWEYLSRDGRKVASSAEMCSLFHSYKEIEKQDANFSVDDIPEGAVLNTLENRENADAGEYVFLWNGHLTLMLKARGFWASVGDAKIQSDEGVFDSAQYFVKITEAALEALARGEQ